MQLGEMVVSSSREMDGAAIAINEQRFAAKMMNVVSADEFGTIAEGSVGEFLKFMPGISISFANGDANSVSMNGAPSDYVPITIGGFEQASANVAELNSDMAARTVFDPHELPVGVFTAVMGGPVFVLLVRRRT